MNLFLRFVCLCLLALWASLYSLVDNIVCKDNYGNDIYFDETYYLDPWNTYYYNAKYKDKFINYAKDHIHDESLNYFGLENLAFQYPNDIAPIIDEVIKRIDNDTISVAVLDKIYDQIAQNDYVPTQMQRIKEAVTKKWTCPLATKIDMLDVLSSDKILTPPATIDGAPKFLTCNNIPPFECIIDKYQGTQTEHHCFTNLAYVITLLKKYKDKYRDANVRNMLLQAFKKEVEECKKGNYVFWHGRQWAWDFKSDMYKQVYNLIAKDPIGDDYVPLRFGDRENDGFCMNYALFGNSQNEPSSTLSYVLRNHDYSYGKVHNYTIKEFFEQFGIETYYDTYHNDFVKLEKLHKEANTHGYGSLLLLSVAPNDIHHVYLAQEGSMGKWERELYLSPTSCSRTHKSKQIIDTMRINPTAIGETDHIEFAMRLKREYALDHKKGLRIFSFNATNPEKMKKYHQFRDSIFARIAADIKAAGRTE